MLKTQTITISDVTNSVRGMVAYRDPPLCHSETKTITYESAQVRSTSRRHNPGPETHLWPLTLLWFKPGLSSRPHEPLYLLLLRTGNIQFSGLGWTDVTLCDLVSTLSCFSFRFFLKATSKGVKTHDSNNNERQENRIKLNESVLSWQQPWTDEAGDVSELQGGEAECSGLRGCRC